MKQYGRINPEDLVRLGLNPQAARIYSHLVTNGPQTVRALATALRVFPHALYRVVYQLKKSGLLTQTKKRPQTFAAITPSLALAAYVRQKNSKSELIMSKILGTLPADSGPNETSIELAGGKDALFREYVKLAESAGTEVLIVSRGEPVPEEIMLANRDCLERGVKIRFLIHRFDAANRDLLLRWVQMGLEVRHLPGAGFHLVVADGKTALLSVSDPDDPGHRVTLRIRSPHLSRALSDYFESVWPKARPVTG